MAKKRSNKTKTSKAKLTVADIAQYGGEEADLDLINNLSDSSVEDMDYHEDVTSEPVRKLDIEKYIQSLGLDKYSAQAMDDDEDDSDDDNDGNDNDDDETQQNFSKSSEGTDGSKTKVKGQENDGEKMKTNSKREKQQKRQNKFKIQDTEISSTNNDTSKSVIISEARLLGEYQQRNYLLVKPGAVWHEIEIPEELSAVSPVLSKNADAYKALAEKLMQAENSLYKQQQENAKRSETSWIKTVLRSGTMNDKISALTLLVHESPVHNIHSLQTLVAMVKKKAPRESLLVIDALKNLFSTTILPSNRRMHSFEKRCFDQLDSASSGNKDIRDKVLTLWLFENNLKSIYSEFVQGLQDVSKDSIVALKKKALNTIYDLLVIKPEQEQELLNQLINKLGDPDQTISTKSIHLLTQLIQKHPNMTLTVVSDIEHFLFRPNIGTKTQYYTVCFLNQVVFSDTDIPLASKLITIYFSFFKAFVKDEAFDTKMLSALLTGVNRAYPYAKLNTSVLDEQLNTLYRVVHKVNFNTALQALMLLQQVTDSRAEALDRFYSILYRKLLDPDLKNTARPALLLNLCYKALKKDSNVNRGKAFIKRLLQVCISLQPTFICGVLILLSEVYHTRPELFNKLSPLLQLTDDDEEEKFIDIVDDEEDDKKAVQETIKAIDDKETVQKQIKAMKEMGANVDSVHPHNTTSSLPRPSWLKTEKGQRCMLDHYDSTVRDPQYAGAQYDCPWELNQLMAHYHPSVVAFTKQVIEQKRVDYSGDPLQDYTLIRFLDRFVYKKPQNKTSDKVQQGTHFRLKSKQPMGLKRLTVNSEKFAQAKEDNIPVDELFYHRYFTAITRKKKEDVDSDAEVDDDEFDEYLENFEKGLIGDEDLDFASDFTRGKKDKSSKKKKKRGDDSNDSSDDDSSIGSDLDSELDGDLSDEEPDFGSDFEMSDADDEDVKNDDDDDNADSDDDDDADSDDEDDDTDNDSNDFTFSQDAGFDEEGLQFSDDESDDAESPFVAKPSKRKASSSSKLPKSKKSKKSFSGKAQDLEMAAEEFSEAMDEVGAFKQSVGTSDDIINKDNASYKQLKWEQARHSKEEKQNRRRKKFPSNKFSKGKRQKRR